MGCIGGNSENAALVKSLCQGKNEDQKKVIKYFVQEEGCMTKNISDDEYATMVASKRDAMNLKAKALKKIGLDEEEVNEIPPVMFQGYTFKNAYAKKRGNGNWVSSNYEVTWIFFSSTQIYVYKCTFAMDEDKTKETTLEYFYKDVTAFSTSSEAEKAKINGKDEEIETEKFTLVVPGDKLYVSMGDIEDADSIIQAMKQKLREKKQ
ncbi:MAG: hypothetical protein J6K52_00165 [Clostridia bacterium]|nr:hypothetical protein [Clostridia bacterium]MBQ7789072.1 hypothetical protein [Clostridia bacterium]